jgi:type VI secretion system protein ImpJ
VPEIPDPIQWHEGMLLMPQHFQQLATRFEGLIQNAVGSAAPFPWGVLSFEYDRSALVNGLLRVTSMEAVLRDGLHIRAGSDVGIDLDLSLKNFADQTRTAPLSIYLVVPAQQALSTRGDLARYASYEGSAVVDETTGEDGITIPRLRPRISLWAGDQPPSRYESVPVMRVQVQGDAFLAADYIAPCVSVAADSPLGRFCGDTLSVVRTKSYLLADQLRSEEANQGDAERFDLQSKIRALSMGLPAVEAALQCGQAHPFVLYLQMCQLAGCVAAITSAIVPPQFPVYRHTELLESFQAVLGFIRMAVAEAAVEAWVAVPFQAVEGRFEAGPNRALDELILADQKLAAPQVVVGLRPPPGVPEETVWRWGEGCVIGTSSFIPVFLSNRVPGAERRRAERVPGLVRHRGNLLFPLVLDRSVAKPGEPLQLVERFLNEGRPGEAVLYLRRPEAQLVPSQKV